MNKILIVDDDNVVAAALKEYLLNKKTEYSIRAASSCAEAVKMMKQECPDVVFLDVRMNGMNGFETLKQIKNDKGLGDVSVIMMTRANEPKETADGFQAGCSDCIVKPFSPEEAYARIDSRIRIKKYQDELRLAREKLKKTQDQLVESSKISSIGVLAAGVAHEFNNILVMMSGHAELVSKSDDTAELRKSIEIIMELIDRGANIVKSLLNLARKDELQTKESANIKEILNRDLKFIKKDSDNFSVKIESNFSDIAPILCYAGQMSQCFINIVKNAIEAMSESDTKKLTINLSRCDHVEGGCKINDKRTCHSNYGCCLISFSDTGRGIADDLKERVFEPFMTTKGVVGGGDNSTPGTGLGLSICQSIVLRHEGFIHVESSKGAGSTFTVAIPYA